ncbi:MAG: DUF4230 domain-containing protein [Cytophagales bacterium]
MIFNNLKLAFGFVLAIVVMYLFFKFTSLELFTKKDTYQELTVVERVQHLGKLELCKYYIKDVIEYKQEIDMLPDPSVLLVISGEAVGCVDLEKITKNNLVENDSTIVLTLPKAEICVWKINHKESKVYNTRFGYFQEADLVDKAYKKAESTIYNTALKQGIEQETRARAKVFLKSFLQAFTKKNIVIK